MKRSGKRVAQWVLNWAFRGCRRFAKAGQWDSTFEFRNAWGFTARQQSSPLQLSLKLFPHPEIHILRTFCQSYKLVSRSLAGSVFDCTSLQQGQASDCTSAWPATVCFACSALARAYSCHVTREDRDLLDSTVMADGSTAKVPSGATPRISRKVPPTFFGRLKRCCMQAT